MRHTRRRGRQSADWFGKQPRHATRFEVDLLSETDVSVVIGPTPAAKDRQRYTKQYPRSQSLVASQAPIAVAYVAISQESSRSLILVLCFEPLSEIGHPLCIRFRVLAV